MTIKPREREKEDQIRLNHRIRVREVRLIGSDGRQLGVMETSRALELARQEGLDLAEISPNAKPPVCKILDYGKYKYELKKKAKEAKKKQVVITTKEIHFRPQTDDHDVGIKVKNIIRLLSEGHKVRAVVRFRGREASHANLGHQLLKQIVDLVGTSGIVEAPPKMEGKSMMLVFSANSKANVKTKQANPTEKKENSPVEVENS
jgi:translation initiation factor IF-3